MKQRNRFLVIITTTALAMSIFAPAASAKAKEIELLTGKTAAITAGAEAWIALNWVADEDVSNFRVTVTDAPNGVTVSYPTNLDGWTGLAGGHYLDKDEVDFTALKLAVDGSVTKDIKMDVEASYEFEGKVQSGNFTVKIPVAVFAGDTDLSQTTKGAVISGDGSWVDVSFAGYAPSSNDFTMKVSEPAGLVVSYPGYGSSTSLHSDARLSAGESDVARFYAHPNGGTGTFPVTIDVTYDAGNGTKTLSSVVEVTVNP